MLAVVTALCFLILAAVKTPSSVCDLSRQCAAGGEFHKIDVVRDILQRNPPQSCLDEALIWCGAQGHASSLELVHTHGANINYHESTQHSAILRAARNGHAQACTMLLKLGANISDLADGSTTPLMEAATWGHTDAVKAILAFNPPLNQRSHDGSTALGLAAGMNGNAQTVLALVNAGADLDIVGTNQQSPLIRAVQRKQDDMVKILLAAGANTEILDMHHNNAQGIASRDKQFEMEKWIKAAQAGDRGTYPGLLVGPGASVPSENTVEANVGARGELRV